MSRCNEKRREVVCFKKKGAIFVTLSILSVLHGAVQRAEEPTEQAQ